MSLRQIGFGGGCHWCTEAVFQSLFGVEQVQQGWIASTGSETSLSEAVIVTYSPDEVSLRDLVWVHLNTHSSQSEHSMRDKYRSAVYYFDEGHQAREVLNDLQSKFASPLVTRVLPFGYFKQNEERYQCYYFSDPGKPFCHRHIEPKLNWLVEEHPELVNPDVLPILSNESILQRLEEIPLGYSKGRFKSRTYGLEKSEFNQGRSVKLFARELGGRDFVSANIYRTAGRLLVKPCEMPRQKVLAFVRDVEL